MAVLLTTTIHYVCPNCTSELVRHGRVHQPIMHPCRGLKGLMAPMVEEGLNCKVEAQEREDYLGEDAGRVILDGDGTPISSVVTTRDDGNDVAVFAPLASAKGDI